MKTIIALIVSLFLASPVYASGWSFGLDGGLAVPTQNYFPTNTGDGNTHSLPYFQALEASEGWMVSAYALHTFWKPWLHLGMLATYDTTGTSSTGPVTPNQYPGSPSTGTKTNLGMVNTIALMPYLRISPWTFGNWTPFLGLGLGWSWNQWNVQSGLKLPNQSFSAGISGALVTHIELGADYRLSDHFSLEGLMGFVENNPLASVALPSNTGGMDQDFQMSLFFVQVGFHFSL